MPELLRAVLSQGLPLALLLAVAGAALVWWAWATVSPRTLVLALLALVFLFEGGAPAVDNVASLGGGFNLYGKGGSVLLFSFFEISVMAAGLAALMQRPLQRAFGAPGATSEPAALPFAAGRLLLAIYLLMATLVLWHIGQTLSPGPQAAPDGVHWLSQLGRPGVLHLLLQGLLVAAIVCASQQEREVRLALALLMALVAARMAWGVLRYALWGGDPRSAYELDAGTPLRITFWDINDSLLACALGAWALWHAALGTGPLPTWRPGPRARAAAGVLALGCFAVAALSGRRTAQGGAALALLTLAWLLPRGRRWPALLALSLALPLAAWKLRDRLDEGAGLAGLPSALARSLSAGDAVIGDPRYRRFHELELAWETVGRHPLFGVGPAGAFEAPSARGLEYHKGNYGFVHSGFGHVLLKTGFAGLALFVALFACALAVLVRQWRRGPVAAREWLVIAAGGLAASLPTLLVGTPLIEIRTMLVLGFFLALPLVAARLQDPMRGPRSTPGPAASVPT